MAKGSSKRKEFLAGVDEAGRGPLAGPVVACAVVIKKNTKKFKELKINDSKKMSPRSREIVYQKIQEMKSVEWAVAVVSEKVIDRVNILEATKIAMSEAIAMIKSPIRKVVVDGNFTIDIDYPQEAVIKADTFINECMLASIIAKVKRDAIMKEAGFLYPQYGFEKHKGYGTKRHYEMLQVHGITPVHRRTFRLF